MTSHTEAPARERRPSTRSVLVTWALITLAGVSAWISAATADPSHQIMVGSLAMFSFSLALLTVLRPTSAQFGLSEFRLGSWMLAFGALAYGLATISLAFSTPWETPHIERSLIIPALSLIAIGYAAFVMAYKIGSPNFVRRSVGRLVKSSVDRPIPRPVTALVSVYAIGLVATGLSTLLHGGYGYMGGTDLTHGSQVSPLAQPLSILTFLRTASLFGLSARWAGHRTLGNLIALTFFTGMELMLGLLSGMKESFIVVALAVGIPMILMSRRRRVPWLPTAAALAVFVFFVTPFVTELRGEVRQGGKRLDVGTSISIGLSSLLGENTITNQTSSRESFQQVTARVRLLDNAVVILDQTPGIHPYRPLTELLTAPATGLIPRAIWPSKPLRLSGLDFYKDYYRGQGMSSSAITMQGGLYMHGGVPVVFLGMVALGFLIRGIDDVTVSSKTVTSGLVPLVLFVPLVKQELDPVTFLAGLPIYALTYWIAVRAVGTRIHTAGGQTRGFSRVVASR